jgi:hypothetical protein
MFRCVRLAVYACRQYPTETPGPPVCSLEGRHSFQCSIMPFAMARERLARSKQWIDEGMAP